MAITPMPYNCKRCWLINVGDSPRCEFCGHERLGSRYEDQCGPGEVYWYCTYCWSENSPRRGYCRSCGLIPTEVEVKR